MNSAVTKYWRILNDYEDLLNGGYRLEHGGPPKIRPRPAAQVAEEVEDSAISGAGDRTFGSLQEIADAVNVCRACPLGEQRTRAVPGEGSGNPDLLVIGEAPGGQEDESGRPFVGAAGRYLDKWLQAIGLSREENAFIANVIKCRPPGNRDPEEDEMRHCFPYLLAQIDLLKPKAILCVGRFAGRRITGQDLSLGRMRGSVHSFRDIPVIVTYHPSAVLRNPELRRPVWDDLQILKDLLAGK